MLPGLNGVTSVAAPNGDGAPVVANSGNDGIVLAGAGHELAVGGQGRRFGG
ncbi:hypothetical protein [Streptomyces narbonensis]